MACAKPRNGPWWADLIDSGSGSDEEDSARLVPRGLPASEESESEESAKAETTAGTKAGSSTDAATAEVLPRGLPASEESESEESAKAETTAGTKAGSSTDAATAEESTTAGTAAGSSTDAATAEGAAALAARVPVGAVESTIQRVINRVQARLEPRVPAGRKPNRGQRKQLAEARKAVNRLFSCIQGAESLEVLRGLMRCIAVFSGIAPLRQLMAEEVAALPAGGSTVDEHLLDLLDDMVNYIAQGLQPPGYGRRMSDYVMDLVQGVRDDSEFRSRLSVIARYAKESEPALEQLIVGLGCAGCDKTYLDCYHINAHGRKSQPCTGCKHHHDDCGNHQPDF